VDILQEIQNLPEQKKKIILWSVIIIIGVILLSFWFNNLQKKIKSFEMEELKEDLEIPSLEEELKNLPELKING
jgi:uncharacterized membrane protein YvbJ